MSSEPTEEDLLDGKNLLETLPKLQTFYPAAVKDSLEKDGRLGRFKAELRSAVLSILNKNTSNKPPHIPEETKFINELMREYLLWNGYLYTEQILIAESGQNQETPSREYLATKLGVLDDSRTVKIPLLYYIISAFQNQEENETNP